MCKDLVLGTIRVEHLTFASALGKIEQALERKIPYQVAFCNAHTVTHAFFDRAYCAALSTMLVLNDGVALDVAAKVITGESFPENLNGTDFIPAFLASSKKPLRVFLLGARPEVVRRAAAELARRYPAHTVIGCRDGYFAAQEEAGIVAEIAVLAPDVLLVAMGNPRQELFMHRHAAALANCGVVFGVGALFDFLSQAVPRAPLWMRRWRLEWLFRLKNEPRRLIYRYSVGAFTFVWAIAMFRLQAGGAAK